MVFFDGMYPYEIIVLFAGVLLFLALLAVFLRKAFSNQSYAALLPFFVVAIAMIGFPSVSAINIGGAVVQLGAQTHELQEHPDNAALRSAAEVTLSNVSARPFSNPATVATLAEAQFALGQEVQAQQNVDKALATDPTLKPAQELKAKIEVANKLSVATAAVEKQPENPQAKQELQNTVTLASQYKFANPNAVANMKKATTVLQLQPGHVNPAMLAIPVNH
jgi:hypothetical protein